MVAHYRVINTCNFGKDHPNESWLSIGVVSKEYGKILAADWNSKHSGDTASRYAMLVPADYELDTTTPE